MRVVIACLAAASAAHSQHQGNGQLLAPGHRGGHLQHGAHRPQRHRHHGHRRVQRVGAQRGRWRIGISNAPARPDDQADQAATHLDGIPAAARSWRRWPFGPPRHSPRGSSGLDPRPRSQGCPSFGNAAPTLRAASPGSTSALQSADVVLMTAGAAQVASVLPDLTRPPSRRGLRVQSQVRQDLLDHRPLQDGRDDLQLHGVAVRAPLHVDVKHTLE